jgi:N utilization substance protein A
MVVSELRGEKIDIIPWNDEPARFLAKALSPARVREVLLDDAAREATVIVPDDQLALAIGKEGLNARLASRLTGWKIDITSDSEFAQQEAEAAYGGDGAEGEDFSGRCSAILSNGKRCPNEAVPGTRYCGLPAHQALAGTEADLPAEAPVTAETATPEEAEHLEPVGRIEEPGGEVVAAGPDLTEDVDSHERVEDEPTGGVPIERADVGDAADDDMRAFEEEVEEATHAPGPSSFQADDLVGDDRDRA